MMNYYYPQTMSTDEHSLSPEHSWPVCCCCYSFDHRRGPIARREQFSCPDLQLYHRSRLRAIKDPPAMKCNVMSLNWLVYLFTQSQCCVLTISLLQSVSVWSGEQLSVFVNILVC